MGRKGKVGWPHGPRPMHTRPPILPVPFLHIPLAFLQAPAILANFLLPPLLPAMGWHN